ncbi:roadblock/LC7 domain-containing protein [Oceanithermus sp.]
MSKQEQIEGILNQLKGALPELQEVIVASGDGLSIAQLGGSENSARLAAMAATAHGLGKRIATTSHLGNLTETVVLGDSAYFIAYAIGDKAVLAITMPSGSNLGLVRLEAQEHARQLAQVL